MTDPIPNHGTDYDRRFIAALKACMAAAPDERAALVTSMGDAELRTELRRIVLEGGPSLAQAVGPGEVLRILSADVSGILLGDWRLERQIDAGGMGRVCLAVHSETGQEAAVKLMLPGAMTAEGLARFEKEAAVMRTITHPSVARIFDADPTASMPWIAMEYVAEAQPITDYARDHDLGLEERVALVQQAALAVNHVHTCGVVHRDIKPGNLLVRWDGVLKVIDFGIARDAVDPEGARLTRTGFVPGTRPYMSPEQLAGLKSAVDSRSDVYSLGVVLFELACGRVPFDPEMTDFADRVHRAPPPRPSRLAGGPRGLDAIVLQALEKNPDRRYPSAGDLAEDLDRLLRGAPVRARRPPALAGLRHSIAQQPVLTGALALALVMAVWGVWSFMLASASRGQESATNAFAQDVILAAIRASPDSAGAFVESVLVQHGDAFLNRPELLQIVGEEVARPLLDRGQYRDAETLLSLARELTEGGLDPDDPALIDLQLIMGILQYRLGRFEEAVDHLAVAEAWHRRTHGGDQVDCLRSVSWRALSLFELGRIEECAPLIEHVLERRRELLGEDDRETLQALACLGRLRRAQGRLEEAEAAYLDTLDLLRFKGEGESYDACIVENNLAKLYWSVGRLEEALEHALVALKGMRAIHHEQHPEVLLVRNLVALIQLGRGEGAWAEEELRAVLSIQERTLGESHGHTLRTMLNLAQVRQAMGVEEGVLELYERAVSGLEAAEGPDTETARAARVQLERLRGEQGDL